MSETLLCPHCEERGCDGRCRFKVGRRGFLGLGLGVAAAALLPVPAEPLLRYVGSVHDSLLFEAEAEALTRATLADLSRELMRIYDKDFFARHQAVTINSWRKSHLYLEGRSWPNEA